MTIKIQQNNPHWNFLIALDADIGQLSRYVEFDLRNFDCFSLEIVRLLLAAGSEVDVVAKQLCKAIATTSKADNINLYRDEICKQYPQIPNFQVISPRFSLTFQPWEEWGKKNGVPFWWTAYNKVKHERQAYYDRANLNNALNAIAGLLVLVLFLYHQDAIEGNLIPSPQILRVHDKHVEGCTAGEYYPGVWYKLDDR